MGQHTLVVPWGLKRFQQTRQLHFLTFSCYHRQPKFGTTASRQTFESAFEQVRQNYNLCVYGYVVMPEHVHMLVNEPEHGMLAQAMQSLKQSVARRLALRAPDPFWQARYCDFNVWGAQVCGEAALHSPQSSGTRIGGTSRGLDLEQFPPLSERGTGSGGD
jgi:REP element-mobilizing transposase RayT